MAINFCEFDFEASFEVPVLAVWCLTFILFADIARLTNSCIIIICAYFSTIPSTNLMPFQLYYILFQIV